MYIQRGVARGNRKGWTSGTVSSQEHGVKVQRNTSQRSIGKRKRENG